MTQQQPQRPAFRHVDREVDNKLEELAADKGVASFVRPAGKRGAGDGAVPGPEKLIPDDAVIAVARETKSVNLDLPLYVWTELKIRAAQRQSSLRHLIMNALRKDGITIHDADMIEDGRRLRGRSEP